MRGKPDRFTEIDRALRDWRERNSGTEYDVIVCGHTHFPGHIGGWHYNSGTWAERTNSFVCIDDNGTAGVFDWTNGRAIPNETELPI